MKAQQARTRPSPKIADRPIAAATPFDMGAISYTIVTFIDGEADIEDV